MTSQIPPQAREPVECPEPVEHSEPVEPPEADASDRDAGPDAARAVLRRAPTSLLAGLRRGRLHWRRSLRMRVVGTTTLLSTAVVLLVGNVLLARIVGGLDETSRDNAAREAGTLISQVQELVRARSGDPEAFAQSLVTRFTLTPDRYVVLRQSLRASTVSPFNDQLPRGLPEDPIPLVMRREVVDDPGRIHTRPVALPSLDDPSVVVAGVAAGRVVDLGTDLGEYEIYFVFRQDREAEILDLVRRVFLVGASTLVLLVAGVAFVVTRQVVAPVRLAARTAEEIASGRLDRRMRVRGEDELARLGAAFNDMAASLERQIHRLEELSRVQRRFVSDVSHELRTPLTTIRMATEVLHEARGGFDPATGRSAELLMTQLDRFEALLADLLEVSRFDAGAAVLEIDAVDVRDLVQRVVEGLRPLADSRGSGLRLDVPGTECIAEIDARRVERVVRNLLGNAIEHGEGRSIDVRVRADGDAAAVVVRDHGVGLTPAQARMVFNRFWRGDPARARTTGGTGLGLAISLEDAHLHGGWLQVWGDPGDGASFRLTLPRRAGVVLTSSPLPLVPPDTGQHVPPVPVGPAEGEHGD